MAPQKQRKGAKKRKKEAKLLKKALERESPSEALAGTKKIMARRQELPANAIPTKTSLHDKKFSREFDKILKLYRPRLQKSKEIIHASSGSTDRSALERCEKASTDLLNDILRMDKEMFLKAIGRRRSNYKGDIRVYLPPDEFFAYLTRGTSRMALGGIEKLQGAFDDFTEALSLMEYQNKETLSNVEELNGEPPFDFSREANFLYFRASTQGKMYLISKDLNQLDGAIQDFRACLAAVRTTDDKKGFLFTMSDVQYKLLRWMVEKKLGSGAQRPHYSQEESTKIAKELGVNLYGPEKYRCGHCGKGNSEVTLQLCARCERTWYCSQDCQRSSWKSGGHKNLCSKHRKTLFFSESDKVLVEMRICLHDFVMAVEDENGQLRLYTDPDASLCSEETHGQLRAIMQDPSSGGYFDSLSNADVVFLPFENTSNDYLHQLKWEVFRQELEELAAVLHIAATLHDGTECD